MTTGLRVVSAPPGATVQDAGRHGYLRYGVTPAGPMDWRGQVTANRLAGNPPDSAVIEIGPGGIVLAAEGQAIRIGLCVPGFEAMRDAAPLPARVALTLQPGQQLSVRPGAGHVWGYLAVAGGLALAPVMGSLSTHLRSGIGPIGALAKGDLLPCLPGTDAPPMCLPDVAPPPRLLRFVPGPQAEAFSDAGFAALCTGPYEVSTQSDRMGYRLTGPRIAHARGHDIVSDGIAMGAIQVPGDGQPIVLMADRQPTGGYPKIGTVIRADLPALAQCRPGTKVHFAPVTVEEAVAALRAALAGLEVVPQPFSLGLDMEKLASGNHASGFLDAQRGEGP
jgi:5-oxoprolinase (ATP-hydrolysing) subunit C